MAAGYNELQDTEGIKYGDYNVSQDWLYSTNPLGGTSGTGKFLVFNPNDTTQKFTTNQLGQLGEYLTLEGKSGEVEYGDLSKYFGNQVGTFNNQLLASGQGTNIFYGQTLEEQAELKKQAELAQQVSSGKITEAQGTTQANSIEYTNPADTIYEEAENSGQSQNGIDSYVLTTPDGQQHTVEKGSKAEQNYLNMGAQESQNQPNQQGATGETNTEQTVAPQAYFSGANLSVGSRGPAVSQLQQALGGLAVDGVFGPKTLAAVKAYQVAHGLTPDGVVGPQTMASLNTPTNSPAQNVNAGTVSSNAPETPGQPKAPPKPKVPVEKSPQIIVSEFHKESLKAVGASDIKKEFDNYTKEWEKLADKKNDETQDINNNPWYSEGVRVQKLRQLDAKYEGKELIISNKLKLAETMYDNAHRQAEFLTGQALDIYSQRELFDQQTMIKGLEIAQQQWEAENSLAESALGTTDLKEYNFAKSEGYTGTFTQYQKEQANLKERIAKAGASVTNIPTSIDPTSVKTGESLATVNSINNILSSPNFNDAFGPTALVKTLIPGSAAYTLNAQIQQVKDQISLSQREKLKGQGQISNFEGLMLANASTALKTGMNPTDARRELINIAGILTTAAGGQTKVLVSSKDGQTREAYADGQTIAKMRADGLIVNYIQ